MVSFETAKKLKDAGLQWEYKQSDCFYYIYSTTITNPDYKGSITHTYKYPGNKFVYSGNWGFGFNFDDEDAEEEIKKVIKHHIFAPRLDQMLAEIEKYTSVWEIGCNKGKYWCILNKRNDFHNDILEECVADALLSIMQ